MPPLRAAVFLIMHANEVVLYAALEQHGDTGDRHKQWSDLSVLRPGHQHRLPLRTGEL